MLGFKGVIDSQHGLLRLSLESGWEYMRSISVLHGPLRADTHNLVDVAMFLCCFLKQRRRRHKPINTRTTGVVASLVRAFVCWLADVLAHYVRSEYSADNPAVHSASPSLKNTGGSARKHTVVAPEAAWGLMERAHKARANLTQAIALCCDEVSLGCSESPGHRWEVKNK